MPKFEQIKDPQSGTRISLARKVMVAATIPLVLGLLAVGGAAVYTAKQELISLQTRNSFNAANMVTDEIKREMLHGDAESVEATIKEMVASQRVLSLSIFNWEGKDRGGGKGDPFATRALQSGEVSTRQLAEHGTHVLVTYLPLKIEERCKKCHDPSLKILGVLKLTSSIEHAFVATKRSSILLLLWGFAALVASTLSLTLVLKVAVTRKITDFVSKVTDLSQGDGDLTRRLAVSGNDELAEVNTQFNHFVETLDSMIANAARTAVLVGGSAGNIQALAQEMAQGVGEAAAQATSVATASEEMSATSGDIAQNCAKAAESSKNSNLLATQGAMVIQNTVEGMTRIAERVKCTATVVAGLGGHSDEIGAIVVTIQDIADQTNLLALNAAIEAARAGENGRGFAVVADEVRALAARTRSATQEIAEMIKAIQQETKVAVEAMEAGVAEVSKGTEDAARSGEALQEILGQIGAVTLQISQIATAAEEQTATTGEISCSINKITEGFAKAADKALSTASEADHLNNLSGDLQNIVQRFKTRESDILMLTIAANDHRLFVNKIRQAVIGGAHLAPDTLPDHHNCRFGKWYEGDGMRACGDLSSYKAIDPLHERIHSLAKQAVALINSKDRNQADQVMAEIEDASRDIMNGLERIRREYIGS